jgi:hypothetical protein
MEIFNRTQFITANDATDLQVASEIKEMISELEDIYLGEFNLILENYFHISRKQLESLQINRTQYRKILDFYLAEKYQKPYMINQVENIENIGPQFNRILDFYYQ